MMIHTWAAAHLSHWHADDRERFERLAVQCWDPRTGEAGLASLAASLAPEEDAEIKILSMTRFYVTTFCNFAHRMRDGTPIDHECYVLSVRDLKAEREGARFERPMRKLRGGVLVRGRKSR